MKALLTISIVCAILALSCARHDDDYTPPELLNQAYNMWEDACNTYVPRLGDSCDAATFVASMSAVCPHKDYGLAAYETEPGLWMRRADINCYTTLGEDGKSLSKSECSRDTYLMVLLDAYFKGDLPRIQRIKDRGEPRKWIMCEGPEGVTSIKPLVSMINAILLGRTPILDVGLLPIPDEFVPDKAVTGCPAHLTATYLWLRGSVLDGLTTAITLKTLHEVTPASPYFSALYHRYDARDNNKEEVVPLMKAVPQEEGDFGWGGAPFQFFRAAAYQVLAGLGAK